jgi:2-dehydropantoate 2-reductase
MRFAIYGSGGVGGYFGGRLAQAGQDVTFIARGAHLAAIQESGLRVESILGDFSISPAQAAADPSQVGVVDVVLVATKAWQVKEAAGHMQALVGPQTIIIPLENGIDAPDELGAALGSNHVLGGLCRISSFIGSPGLIRHVGVSPYIAFGERDGTRSARVEELRAVLSTCAGLTVEVPADIEAAMWDKFIFIAAVSGMGAITRQPLGGFRSIPESRALVTALLEETSAVARARGIQLPADQVQKTLAFIDNAAPGLVPSMQKDIMEGRPSELFAQNGAVMRAGQALGIPTPAHAMIYACLLPAELRARAGSVG